MAGDAFAGLKAQEHILGRNGSRPERAADLPVLGEVSAIAARCLVVGAVDHGRTAANPSETQLAVPEIGKIDGAGGDVKGGFVRLGQPPQALRQRQHEFGRVGQIPVFFRLGTRLSIQRARQRQLPVW